jgi:hypothetical protein
MPSRNRRSFPANLLSSNNGFHSRHGDFWLVVLFVLNSHFLFFVPRLKDVFACVQDAVNLSNNPDKGDELNDTIVRTMQLNKPNTKQILAAIFGVFLQSLTLVVESRGKAGPQRKKIVDTYILEMEGAYVKSVRLL